MRGGGEAHCSRVLLFDIVGEKEGMRGRRSPGAGTRLVSYSGRRRNRVSFKVLMYLFTRLCREPNGACPTARGSQDARIEGHAKLT